MAIISRRPWTTKQIGNEAAIYDADGKIIGLFHDWQDAEFIITKNDTIANLQSQVERINDILTDKVDVLQLDLQ